MFRITCVIVDPLSAITSTAVLKVRSLRWIPLGVNWQRALRVIIEPLIEGN